MKTSVLKYLAAGLGALALALTVSCAKQTGPLSPSINQLGAGNGLNQNLLTLASSGHILPANVSQTAQVIFDQALDPTTVVKNSTVLLYTLDDSGTSETQYHDFVLAIEPGLKVLTISPSNGAWTNNKRYHIVFTPGLRASSGGQLDGNYNTIPESADFDTFHFIHSLGAPVAPSYNEPINGIEVSASVSTVSSGSSPLDFGPAVVAMNCAYSYVTITATFSPSDSTPVDFQMDPATFFASATTLHPNVALTDLNGAAVTPASVSLASVANPGANDRLVIAFAAAANTKYQLVLKGGPGGIRSSNAATLRLMRGYYFAPNGSGFAYQSDDTKPAVFQTYGGVITPYVHAIGTGVNTALRCLEVTYSVPTGDGTLDMTTVNTTNFGLIDTFDFNPDRYYVPARVEVDNSTAPNPVVRIYVPQYFDRQAGDTNLYLRAFASKNVRASDQTPVDQTGDGVTGRDNDNYLTAGSGSLFFNNTGENMVY